LPKWVSSQQTHGGWNWRYKTFFCRIGGGMLQRGILPTGYDSTREY
jgi:hypothetical protein